MTSCCCCMYVCVKVPGPFRDPVWNLDWSGWVWWCCTCRVESQLSCCHSVRTEERKIIFVPQFFGVKNIIDTTFVVKVHRKDHLLPTKIASTKPITLMIIYVFVLKAVLTWCFSSSDSSSLTRDDSSCILWLVSRMSMELWLTEAVVVFLWPPLKMLTPCGSNLRLIIC